MQLSYFFIVAALLCLETEAMFGPVFKTSSPGFHGRRLSKLKDSTGFKLPGTARPVRYDLTLNVVFEEIDKYMDGEVIITLDVDDVDGNGTYDLLLNSNIQFDSPTDQTFLWNDNISCSLAEIGAEFIRIQCPQRIDGTDQRLKITYSKIFNYNEMKGAYLIQYMESGSQKTMVATQFEQDAARLVMPCFDEPEYKAPIQLTLKTISSGYTDWISNTKVYSSEWIDTTYQTVFEETPTMSTYLLAFIITTDFKNFTNSNLTADYDFSVFARPTAEGYVSTAVENGPKLIDLMDTFTQIPYTTLGNDKMTLAAIPEFSAGAMENWGLITFREQYLIDEGPNRTTRRDIQSIIEVIAHELTHQWFGDYVTTDWWSETWLNEGFAEYFEYYLTDQILEDAQMMQQLIIKEQQQAFKTDAYPDTIPLANNASDVTTDDDFTNEFGDVSYCKGSSTVKMIRYAMGDEAFQKGLNTYLTNNKFSNSTSEILINTLQEAVSSDQSLNLPTVLHAWIYEKGYPILDVSVDDKNTVSIRSTKFSSSLNKTGENNTANWWIPLTYATSATPNFDKISFDWIDPTKVSDFTLTLPEDSWIIVNLQAAGFYRVNYDETLWNRIIKVLNNSETFSTINVVNRAQLLDDAFNIARSVDGDEDAQKEYYLRAFRLSEYLQFETEYLPWYTFFTEMQYLMEKIQDVKTLTTLQETILNIVSPQVVIPPTSGTPSHTEVLRRNLLLSWACRVGHEKCIEWALTQFKSYASDSSSIDNNYRDAIICTGLAHTNQSKQDFTLVFNNLKQSSLPLEGSDLAKALTCLNSELLLNKTLQSTLNFLYPPFSRMFFDTLLTGLISQGSDKVTIALRFVLEYQNKMVQYWQAIETREAALKKVAAKVYSQDQIDLIQIYIDTSHADTTSKSMLQAAKDSIEIAKKNIAWLEKYDRVLTSVIVYDGGEIPAETTTDSPFETTTHQNSGSVGMIISNVLLIALSTCLMIKIWY